MKRLVSTLVCLALFWADTLSAQSLPAQQTGKVRKDIAAALRTSSAPSTQAGFSAQTAEKSIVETLENRRLSQLSFETFAKYLQLAYDRNLLTQKANADGAGATYVFKSSLFALDGLTRGDFDELSTQQGNTFMRHFGVELGAKTGQGTTVSDGVVGFTWAIIDKRDPFFNFPSNIIELQAKSINSLDNAADAFEKSLAGKTAAEAAPLRAKLAAARAQDQQTQSRDAETKLYQEQGLEVYPYTLAVVADALKTRGLVTLFGRANSNLGKTQGLSHSELGLRYLKGWLPAGSTNALELDAKAVFAWDTTASSTGESRGLNHQALITTVGMNKVLLSSSDAAKPLLEFKLNAGYEYRPTQLYEHERRTKVYGETSLRVRVNEQVWVPLTIQYDTQGHVLGFLKVVWNLVPS